MKESKKAKLSLRKGMFAVTEREIGTINPNITIAKGEKVIVESVRHGSKDLVRFIRTVINPIQAGCEKVGLRAVETSNQEMVENLLFLDIIEAKQHTEIAAEEERDCNRAIEAFKYIRNILCYYILIIKDDSERGQHHILFYLTGFSGGELVGRVLASDENSDIVFGAAPRLRRIKSVVQIGKDMLPGILMEHKSEEFKEHIPAKKTA